VHAARGRTVRLTRGDFFGEMSLLAAAPPIARTIMGVLSQRIREANAWYSPCA